MVAPNIECFDELDVASLDSISFDSTDKDTVTAEKTFNIYNDKTGAAGSATATSCRLSIKTLWDAAIGATIVDEGWVKAKCTSYGDAVFTDMIGNINKEIGSTNSVDTIPSTECAIVVLKIAIPADAIGRIHGFKIFIDYQY